MARIGNRMLKLGSAFFVVTVVLLVPSTGLITLAVPDDAAGSATVASIERPQTTKRAFDDVRTPFIAVSEQHRLSLIHIVSGDVRFAPTSTTLSYTVAATIRAPPLPSA